MNLPNFVLICSLFVTPSPSHHERDANCSSLGVEHSCPATSTLMAVPRSLSCGGAGDEFLVRDHGEAGLRRPALPTFPMDRNSHLLKAKFQDT